MLVTIRPNKAADEVGPAPQHEYHKEWPRLNSPPILVEQVALEDGTEHIRRIQEEMMLCNKCGKFTGFKQYDRNGRNALACRKGCKSGHEWGERTVRDLEELDENMERTLTDKIEKF